MFLLVLMINYATAFQLASNQPGELQLYEITSNTFISNRYSITKLTLKILNPLRVLQNASFQVNIPKDALITNIETQSNGKVVHSTLKPKQSLISQSKPSELKLAKSSEFANQLRPIQLNLTIPPTAKLELNLQYEGLLTRSENQYQFGFSGFINLPVNVISLNVLLNDAANITNVSATVLTQNVVLDTALQPDTESVDKKTWTDRNEPFVKFSYQPSLPLQQRLFNRPKLLTFWVKYDVEYKNTNGQLLSNGDNFVHFYRTQNSNITNFDVLFLMDASASTYGRTLTLSKAGVWNIISKMNENDSFNIMSFSLKQRFWRTSSVKATSTNKLSAKQFIDRIKADRSTDLYSALRTGIGSLNPSPDTKIQSFLVALTDGIPTDGIVKEDKIIEGVQSWLKNKNVCLFNMVIDNKQELALVNGIQSVACGKSIGISQNNIDSDIYNAYNHFFIPSMSTIRLNYPNSTVASNVDSKTESETTNSLVIAGQRQAQSYDDDFGTITGSYNNGFRSTNETFLIQSPQHLKPTNMCQFKEASKLLLKITSSCNLNTVAKIKSYLGLKDLEDKLAEKLSEKDLTTVLQKIIGSSLKSHVLNNFTIIDYGPNTPTRAVRWRTGRTGQRIHPSNLKLIDQYLKTYTGKEFNDHKYLTGSNCTTSNCSLDYVNGLLTGDNSTNATTATGLSTDMATDMVGNTTDIGTGLLTGDNSTNATTATGLSTDMATDMIGNMTDIGTGLLTADNSTNATTATGLSTDMATDMIGNMTDIGTGLLTGDNSTNATTATGLSTDMATDMIGNMTDIGTGLLTGDNSTNATTATGLSTDMATDMIGNMTDIGTGLLTGDNSTNSTTATGLSTDMATDMIGNMTDIGTGLLTGDNSTNATTATGLSTDMATDMIGNMTDIGTGLLTGDNSTNATTATRLSTAMATDMTGNMTDIGTGVLTGDNSTNATTATGLSADMATDMMGNMTDIGTGLLTGDNSTNATTSTGLSTDITTDMIGNMTDLGTGSLTGDNSTNATTATGLSTDMATDMIGNMTDTGTGFLTGDNSTNATTATGMSTDMATDTIGNMTDLGTGSLTGDNSTNATTATGLSTDMAMDMIGNMTDLRTGSLTGDNSTNATTATGLPTDMATDMIGNMTDIGTGLLTGDNSTNATTATGLSTDMATDMIGNMTDIGTGLLTGDNSTNATTATGLSTDMATDMIGNMTDIGIGLLTGDNSTNATTATGLSTDMATDMITNTTVQTEDEADINRTDHTTAIGSNITETNHGLSVLANCTNVTTTDGMLNTSCVNVTNAGTNTTFETTEIPNKLCYGIANQSEWDSEQSFHHQNSADRFSCIHSCHLSSFCFSARYDPASRNCQFSYSIYRKCSVPSDELLSGSDIAVLYCYRCF